MPKPKQHKPIDSCPGYRAARPHAFRAGGSPPGACPPGLELVITGDITPPVISPAIETSRAGPRPDGRPLAVAGGQWSNVVQPHPAPNDDLVVVGVGDAFRRRRGVRRVGGRDL